MCPCPVEVLETYDLPIIYGGSSLASRRGFDLFGSEKHAREELRAESASWKLGQDEVARQAASFCKRTAGKRNHVLKAGKWFEHLIGFYYDQNDKQIDKVKFSVAEAFMLNELFIDKKPDFQRLTDFGFSRVSGDYIYSTTIVDGQFRLDIRV